MDASSSLIPRFTFQIGSPCRHGEMDHLCTYVGNAGLKLKVSFIPSELRP